MNRRLIRASIKYLRCRSAQQKPKECLVHPITAEPHCCVNLTSHDAIIEAVENKVNRACIKGVALALPWLLRHIVLGS